MGIPGIFRKFFVKRIKAAIMRDVPAFVSSLAFDLNGVIHDAKAIVLGSNVTDERILKAIGKLSREEIETLIIEMTINIIKDLVVKINPHDYLILCVDGIAPNAKLQQQKGRRERNALNSTGGVFDTNAITPGTEFMNKLDDQMIVFLNNYRNYLPPNIIYSSHLVAGEGEHKIMEYYRSKLVSNAPAAKAGGAHILHGMDADLIMLSLLSPLRNIFLFRENKDYDKRKADEQAEIAAIPVEKGKRIDYKVIRNIVQKYNAHSFDIINIQAIKRYLLNKFGQKNNAIDDFVLMCFLLGNDFIPHNPAFEDVGETVMKLIDIYIDNNLNLTQNNEIDWQQFGIFVAKLAEEERKSLMELATTNQNIKYPSRFIEGAIRNNRFYQDRFTSLWYKNALGNKGSPELEEEIATILGTKIEDIPSPQNIEQMGIDYLKTIAWNFLYYKKGTKAINQDWIYPYHHVPLLKEVAIILENQPQINGYQKHNFMIPFTALHQLVAVLPLKSINLLPTEIKPLFGFNSMVRDLFASSFIIEYDGKHEEWAGIPLIPFIDRQRIYDAVNQLHISESKMKKWAPQQDLKLSRPATNNEKQLREAAAEQRKAEIEGRKNRFSTQISDKPITRTRNNPKTSPKIQNTFRPKPKEYVPVFTPVETVELDLAPGFSIGKSVTSDDQPEFIPGMVDTRSLTNIVGMNKTTIPPPKTQPKTQSKTQIKPQVKTEERKRDNQPIMRARGGNAQPVYRAAARPQSDLGDVM